MKKIPLLLIIGYMLHGCGGSVPVHDPPSVRTFPGIARMMWRQERIHNLQVRCEQPGLSEGWGCEQVYKQFGH